jgi:hypothetical protein
MQALHPHLDLFDQLIRMFGWPALLGILVWAIRTYDKGARELKDIRETANETKRMVLETHGGLVEIKTNHFVHLQDGITRLADSNDKAVEVLHDIKTGIGILSDRFPRN